MSFGYSDNDDVQVKGDDGSESGKKITAIQDGSDYRLAVNTKIKGDTDGSLIGNTSDALKVFTTNEATINVGSANTDLFDRLSIAEDTPLWTYNHRFTNDQSIYWDTVASAGGTAVINTSRVSVEVKNSTGNGDTITYRTYRYFEYSKGRQQTFMFAVNPQGKVSGVTKEVGGFDDNNGFFFRFDGSNTSVVVRSNVSGSPVDTVVTQPNFNQDVADGTTSSGINMGSWDKYNVLYIQYGGVVGNAVEFGIFDGGKRKPFHLFEFTNSSADPYTQHGQLPFNVKLTNTTAQGSQPQLDLGFIGIFNNGRQDNLGQVISLDSGVTEITVSTTPQVISAIRMTASQNRASIKPLGFDLLSPSGNSTIYYEVLLGGTFTGDSWASITGSISEELTSYTTFTGGQLLQSGYVQAGGARDIQNILSDLYIGRSISGDSQNLAVLARTVSSNAKVLFSGRYREYK